MALNVNLLTEFAELDLQQKELNRQLNEIKKKKGEMEATLIDHMLEEGTDHIRIKDLRITLYIHEQIWAQYQDKPLAIQALKEAGLDEYVYETFNSHQVSAFMREEAKNDRELPAEWKGILEANPKTYLRTRKKN